MEQVKQLIIRFVLVTIGLFGVGVGTGLLLSIELGSSTVGVLTDGVHNVFSISNGTANIIVNVLFLLIVVLAARDLINIGTILTTILVGLFINLTQNLLAPLQLASMPYYIRFLLALLSIGILGVSLGYYVSIDFGMGPYEGFVTIIHKKTGWAFKRCKQLSDLLVVLLGLLLGAKFGLGTLMAVLLTGPCMQQALKFFRKQHKKLGILKTGEESDIKI